MTDVGTNGLTGCSSLPPRTTLFSGQLGLSLSKDEVITPNFAEQKLNSERTIEAALNVRLWAEADCFRANLNFDYSQHVYGAKNPYYPQGLRLFDVSIEGRGLLGSHLDVKLGKFSLNIGPTWGNIAGAQFNFHTHDRKLALTTFAGALTDFINQDPNGQVAWGLSAGGNFPQTSLALNFHQVFDHGELARTRLGLEASNQSLSWLEARAQVEYDPLLNKMPRLSVAGDFQLQPSHRLGLLFQRKDPTFNLTDFFRIFPTEPYYLYRLSYDLKKKKLSLALSGGQTFYAHHLLTFFSAEARFYGVNLGGSVQFATAGSDPRFSYVEAHAGYSAVIKQRVALGASANIFYYDQLGGKVAWAATPYLRAEVARNLVFDFSATFRQSYDGSFDPLGTIKLTYFFHGLFPWRVQ